MDNNILIVKSKNFLTLGEKRSIIMIAKLIIYIFNLISGCGAVW